MPLKRAQGIAYDGYHVECTVHDASMMPRAPQKMGLKLRLESPGNPNKFVRNKTEAQTIAHRAKETSARIIRISPCAREKSFATPLGRLHQSLGITLASC